MHQLPGDEAPQPAVAAELEIKESAAPDVAMEQATPLPLPGRSEPPNEFIWLFENLSGSLNMVLRWMPHS